MVNPNYYLSTFDHIYPQASSCFENKEASNYMSKMPDTTMLVLQ